MSWVALCLLVSVAHATALGWMGTGCTGRYVNARSQWIYDGAAGDVVDDDIAI